MQVWDGVSDSRISFDWPSASGAPQRSPQQKIIANMTENLNITSALLARLDELGGVSIFDKTRVDGVQLGNDTQSVDLRSWPVVELSSGQRLAARHGVVATLKMEGDGWRGAEEKIAYQRFLPSGPVALLPLPGCYSTLVWSTLPEYAAHLKSLSSTEFVAMVNAAFRLSPVDIAYMHTQPSGQSNELSWREQHTKFNVELVPQRVVDVQEGSVASFPLRMRHADTYIGERVALIGDAAHTIHPLAGQGLNQGQGDVESLAQTIKYAVEHGQDIGKQMSLEAYNSERWNTNNRLLGVVDKLHKLYSVGSGPLVPLRSWGLSAVNAMGPLKEFFMKQASGTR